MSNSPLSLMTNCRRFLSCSTWIWELVASKTFACAACAIVARYSRRWLLMLLFSVANQKWLHEMMNGQSKTLHPTKSAVRSRDAQPINAHVVSENETHAGTFTCFDYCSSIYSYSEIRYYRNRRWNHQGLRPTFSVYHGAFMSRGGNY